MKNCPVCQSKLFENADIILFATATEPDEYSEPYMVCSKCEWTDRPAVTITEEIPF